MTGRGYEQECHLHRNTYERQKKKVQDLGISRCWITKAKAGGMAQTLSQSLLF